MAKAIIGRKEEIAVLDDCYQEERAHFVAVFGRRRVGKTFLIKKHFEKRIFFTFTGSANASLRRQITNFNIEAHQQLAITDEDFVKDWFGAFQLLRNKIEASKIKKKVVFIDELPWLDTRNSNFIAALEYFWNGWANMRKDVLLIGCGSAASWMINKLVNNKGGLHHRVTKRLRIEPFSLAETDLFLKYLGARYNHYQTIQLYMAFGGVPFYLEQIDTSLSDVQNINNLCFKPNAFFKTEYHVLFSSLFQNFERHQLVLQALAKKGQGMSRSEILEATALGSGGTITTVLKELEESSFIRRYPALGKKEKDQLYQLIDFFSLFYLNHIRKATHNSNYWIDTFNTSKYYAWAGYSFELVCLLHIDQIKQALGISGIGSEVFSWRSSTAQIDMLIDRKDQVINLCEIKFSLGKFKMTKKNAGEIQHKVQSFISSGFAKNKAIFPTIITNQGLEHSIHNGVFVNKVTFNNLFK